MKKESWDEIMPVHKANAAINTAQKARSINPERKRKSKVERLKQLRIGRSRKGDIIIWATE